MLYFNGIEDQESREARNFVLSQAWSASFAIKSHQTEDYETNSYLAQHPDVPVEWLLRYLASYGTAWSNPSLEDHLRLRSTYASAYAIVCKHWLGVHVQSTQPLGDDVLLRMGVLEQALPLVIASGDSGIALAGYQVEYGTWEMRHHALHFRPYWNKVKPLLERMYVLFGPLHRARRGGRLALATKGGIRRLMLDKDLNSHLFEEMLADPETPKESIELCVNIINLHDWAEDPRGVEHRQKLLALAVQNPQIPRKLWFKLCHGYSLVEEGERNPIVALWRVESPATMSDWDEVKDPHNVWVGADAEGLPNIVYINRPVLFFNVL